MKTLIVGLGNPIFGDDGVGWKIAEEVNRLLSSSTGTHTETNENFVSVEYLSLGGLGLMEHLVGYDNAILIDAFRSEEAKGSILVMRLEDMPNYSAFHTTSVHDASLQNALEFGSRLGAKLPKHIMVVGVTTEKCFEFCEGLTPEVQAAVPMASRAALDLLEIPT
jgi:hydrogenase maturation protease